MYRSSGPEIVLVIVLIVCVLYLTAWVMTMLLVTKAARDKGYHIDGQLWFIGLFGLIFTPGIIVAALPDRRDAFERADSSRDELPSI